MCFSVYVLIKGITPKDWGKGIIKPIPKSNSTAMDPWTYRGNTISCSMYKLFCSVLLNRLSVWCDVHKVIVDEQNGFRVGGSTLDHLFSL